MCNYNKKFSMIKKKSTILNEYALYKQKIKKKEVI